MESEESFALTVIKLNGRVIKWFMLCDFVKCNTSDASYDYFTVSEGILKVSKGSAPQFEVY